ncbi:hypothetical protein SAMN04487898_113168 [Pedobacter sp. ok626]|nr:hypothetical protein SAMN04487898_113168 [Pedobacter sp. ok626]
MLMNIIYKISVALFLMLGTQLAFAQENDVLNTPATLERQEQNSFWKKAKNPAGLQLDRPFEYSQLSVGIENYGGDFRRPQQGKSGNRQLVQTEGNLFLGDYYLSGAFSYTRDNIKQAEFNASIIDPFRGMPYMVADLNPSDWNNQYYDMQFSIATPTFNERWSFGLAANYKVSSGAKQRDLRAENYYYTIAITPGLVYTPATNHHIGLNLAYSNVKEQSSISKMNTDIDQVYYELLGLGTAVSNSGTINRENNYEGDVRGAGIQYNFQGKVNVFLSADYSEEAEDLQVSFSTPRDGASVLRKIWNTKLTLSTSGGKLSHFVDLNYYNRNMDGIQYVTQRDNSSAQLGWQTLFKSIRSTYSSQNAGFQYHLLMNRGAAYSWKINTGLSYERLNDVYILPNSVKQIENLLFTIGGKKNFMLSDKKSQHLLVGAELGYKENLSGGYHYNGVNPESPVVTGLEQTDFNYLSAKYFSVAVPFIYSRKIKEDSKNTFFAKARVQYLSTNSFNYKERYLSSFSAGVNF